MKSGVLDRSMTTVCMQPKFSSALQACGRAGRSIDRHSGTRSDRLTDVVQCRIEQQATANKRKDGAAAAQKRAQVRWSVAAASSAAAAAALVGGLSRSGEHSAHVPGELVLVHRGRSVDGLVGVAAEMTEAGQASIS